MTKTEKKDADVFERFPQGTFENCNHNYSISILNKNLTTIATAAISSEYKTSLYSDIIL
jgi:hypothetical protein